MNCARRLYAIAVATILTLAVAGCGGGPHTSAAHARSAHAPGFGLPPKGLTLPRPQLGVSTAEMFDTITLSSVPGNPFAVAGYTAGFWPTYLPLVRAFPHAIVKSIAIAAGYHAGCLDIEPGDAVPGQAGPWVRADLAAGFKHPCLYANLSTMPAVRANLAAWGIPRSAVFLWDANWTYVRHLDSGYDATQWNDHAYGRNLDESTVSLAFLGISPKPKPKPPARLICFGAQASHAAKCKPIVALYARRQRALAATNTALTPLERTVRSLQSQARWFDSHSRSLVKAYS